MKICYVATDIMIPGVTGGSTHTYEVARQLAKLGHEVSVICRRQPGQRKEEFIDEVHIYRLYRGVLVPTRRVRWKDETRPLARLYRVYLNTVFLVHAAITVAGVIRKVKAELVLERGTSVGEGALAGLICRRPSVLEVIGPRFSSLSFRRARRVLAFSLNAIGTWPRDKIQLVRAAANVDLFNPEVDGSRVRKELSLEGFIVVGYAGSFAPWHGVETLLQAMSVVVEQLPQTKLLLVGPGSELVKALVDSLRLASHTVIRGPVSYEVVPAHLAACDLLVAPYSPRYGGDLYSYVKIFEYMAMGRPVVTTYGVPDAALLKDRQAAVLVPPDDPSALARAIITLVGDDEERNSLSQRGRLVAYEHSWRDYVRRLDQLLLETFAIPTRALRPLSVGQKV